MSAMRKVKFAVLESSLLARKGCASPAVAEGPEYEHGVSRADAEPHVELVGDNYEGNLASLIVRPIRPRPRLEPEVRTVEARDAEWPAAPTCAVPGARADQPEDEASIAEIIKAWTRKVAKDRRIATNLHPRGLNRDQAARYVGLSPTTFARLVREGVMPEPIHFGRRVVWDRRAIDEALDRMSGHPVDTPVVRDA